MKAYSNSLRPNGDKILVSKKTKFTVNIGDIVSFAVIANKKLQATHIHKLTCVRHDLQWQHVVDSYS